MSMRPQSAQVGGAKKSTPGPQNQNIAKTTNGQVIVNQVGGGANPKSGTVNSSRQHRQHAASLTIKRKKNQSAFSFYKDICQKLNCNINNAISHGLKEDEMIINVDNLTSSDVEPMRILLRECDFSIITLTGNKEFSEEQFYQEHEQIIFKYRNKATNQNGNAQNNFAMLSNGFSQHVEERGRVHDQGDEQGNRDGRFAKTPLGSHNGQKARAGDTSNKNQGLKDHNAGFKKLSSAAADGSNSNKNGGSKSKKSKQNFSNYSQSFNAVMHAVGVNIARVTNSQVQLTSIKIINLQLRAESLAGICQGLQKSHTVKELYIQNCGLTSETIEKGMLVYMTEIKSLILLDLSFNKLDGQSGGLIGKLLSSHSKNRDEHIWLCGLRGEVPENDVNLEGICEVNLMGNLLTDKSIKDLCYFLQFDGWTRSVNLRYNRIGADGLVELNKMLDNNENLISLDIRNNPGMTPNYDDFVKYGDSIKNVSKSIYDKLLNNIKVFKHKRDDMRRKQHEQIITNLQYENNNQLPPSIFPQFQQDEVAIMMMALQHQQQHPEQNVEEHILYAQQQQQLLQNAHLLQQQQQQQLQLQQQQQIIPQQQNFFPWGSPEQQQQPQDVSQKGHKSKQNSQQIQPQELQVGKDGQVILNQQGHLPQLPQDQQYQHLEEQGEDYQEEHQEEGHEAQESQDHEHGQEQEEQHGGEGEEEEVDDEELTEQQLILKEKQNFVISDEFIEIQQQNFEELYGENEEFLNLPEEQQAEIFQQFLAHQQEQYLLELENEEQMEGVQEVQEEQYEEDEEEDEEQPHDNLYNEQQIYYQQSEGKGQNPQGNVNQQIQHQNQQNDLHNQGGEFHENEDQDATDQHQNEEEFAQEIEEDEHDEENIKQVMEQIYEELQLESIVNKDCKCCLQLQDKILQSEYEKLNLMIKWNNCQLRLAQMEKQNASQNANLKQQIQQLQIAASQQNQQFQQQQIANSWSAIQPNTTDQENNNLMMHPESFLLGKQQQQLTMNQNNQGGEQIDGEDMLNRIEGLMTELTRLMDNLETMQNNVTNNITCQLSNTTNTNNQTYHLLNSNPNINFNNTFTNILGGSHNNSNILPRNANSNFLNNLTQQTAAIQQQQTSTFVPSSSSNNNTQIQQVSSTQSGQKKQKKNPQRQIVQQQYYQQQQQQQQLQQPQQILAHQQQQQQQQQLQHQEQIHRNQQKFNVHNNSN